MICVVVVVIIISSKKDGWGRQAQPTEWERE